jgi:hypothetical protein
VRADLCLYVDSAGSHFIPAAIFCRFRPISPFSSYFAWGGNVPHQPAGEVVGAIEMGQDDGFKAGRPGFTRQIERPHF